MLLTCKAFFIQLCWILIFFYNIVGTLGKYYFNRIVDNEIQRRIFICYVTKILKIYFGERYTSHLNGLTTKKLYLSTFIYEQVLIEKNMKARYIILKRQIIKKKCVCYKCHKRSLLCLNMNF